LCRWQVEVIGEAGPQIAKSVKRAGVIFADSMEAAVAQARGIAEAGDVVLLSPGCASFDMFSSAEARGDAFVAAVRDVEHAR